MKDSKMKPVFKKLIRESKKLESLVNDYNYISEDKLYAQFEQLYNAVGALAISIFMEKYDDTTDENLSKDTHFL